MWKKDEIAKIAAKLELKDGYYVNLGIGLPTQVANYVPKGIKVHFHSENGLIGMGAYPKTKQEADPDLINAGKESITIAKGASFFSSDLSFAMIRGGHVDLSILGSMQVSQNGDIANWAIPNKMIKGMGGAMDIVYGAKRVVVIMEHVAKNGDMKILKECTFPLTGVRCIDRVITNLCVFDFVGGKMILRYKAPGVSVQEIMRSTGCDFLVADDQLDYFAEVA